MKKLICLLLMLVLSALAPSTVTSAHSGSGSRTRLSKAAAARACLYIPGVSVPATMPPEVVNAPRPTPFPSPIPPSPTKVDAKTTARQLRVLNKLQEAVNQYYVYPDFRGRDWKAIGDRYRSLVQGGLSDDDFYWAMDAMINELGDEHSRFESPAQIKEQEADTASQYNFVGIGVQAIALQAGEQSVITTVFADSPAAKAGLLSHDVILRVDGGPVRDKAGNNRTLGVEGTPLTLTIQRPGEKPHDVTLTRQRVTGILPIDYCIISNIRIGYIFLPTLLDKTIPAQVRSALKVMTADGPLDGLILDNRLNGGGYGSVARVIMGLFTSGNQGNFINRRGRSPLQIIRENIGGSQTVPLVVLVDINTGSFGEIVSGVLRVAGRAKIVGGPTHGNVEQLRAYNFEDGSRVWIATDTFQPRGLTNAVWEDAGIVPDVVVQSRWDLFSEATDPALAKAVELLMKK